jgi:NADH-quinone oxidoreductase subunit G
LAAEVSEPCVARIYQLDSIVRRASALQMTADARNENNGQEVLA